MEVFYAGCPFCHPAVSVKALTLTTGLASSFLLD